MIANQPAAILNCSYLVQNDKDNEQLQKGKRKFNKISITKVDNRKKCSLEF